MLLSRILPAIALAFFMSSSTANDKDRNATQQELDAACESARNIRIDHERTQHIEECVEKQNRQREDCESFYSNYGARSGNRAPLYYDLPECEKAFEFSNSRIARDLWSDASPT